MASINLSFQELLDITSAIYQHVEDHYYPSNPKYHYYQLLINQLHHRFASNATEADYAEDEQITKETLNKVYGLKVPPVYDDPQLHYSGR